MKFRIHLQIVTDKRYQLSICHHIPIPTERRFIFFPKEKVEVHLDCLAYTAVCILAYTFHTDALPVVSHKHFILYQSSKHNILYQSSRKIQSQDDPASSRTRSFFFFLLTHPPNLGIRKVWDTVRKYAHVNWSAISESL